MSRQILEDRKAGLIAKIDELQGQANRFNEAKGLDRAILKASARASGLSVNIQAWKEQGAENKEAYRTAIQGIIKPIMERLDAVLPEGVSGVSIEGKSVDIVWIKDNKARPYKALSGGEKAAFDAAMAAALKADIIIVEAAEIDQKNFSSELDKLAELDQQVIVLTCHTPKGALPNKFKVVTL